MPVKRRNAKRRLNDAAALEAWRGIFDCGSDFFGDLEPFGIIESPFARSTEESEKNRAALEAAGREAWEHLGGAFMAGWEPTQVREKPWAFEQFGEPR